MMTLLKTFLSAWLLLSVQYMKAQSNKFNEKNIAIKWELISGNFNNTGKPKAAFVFVNQGKDFFPKSGWSVFFCSNRSVETISDESGIGAEHINGDLFRLFPKNNFKGLAPGDSLSAAYFSGGQLINYTAAPAGLYIVWDNDKNKGYPISNFKVAPLKNTAPDLITPQKVFEQNSIITDIPFDKLPKLFPTPVSFKEMAGDFVLDKNVQIKSPDLFKNESAYLAKFLAEKTGEIPGINLKNGSSKNIVFIQNNLPAEAYKLTITNNEISIAASSGAGIFYGIQSLESLMEGANIKKSAIKIPAAEIEDAPRFGYRALLLDIARNFKTKAEMLKIIDAMAMYKMNVLHFHFSDDEGWRIQIPSFPELTEIGAMRGHSSDQKKMLQPSYASGPEAGKNEGSGYYSRKDFIDILKYATQRHIQVIPEIETPGHARAAIKAMDARYEKFLKLGNKAEAERYLLRDLNDKSVYSSAQRWNDNVICVAMPSVYNFLDKVIEDLLKMYKEADAPINTIHLGGDEVPSGVWEKSPVCLSLIKSEPTLKNIDDLWGYYFRKMQKIAASKGLAIAGWEEVGMHKIEKDGKAKMDVNPDFTNQNIQLHVWNNMPGWGNEDLPYRLANAGYKVILSPVSHNYFDLAYQKSPDEPGYYWGGFEDIDKPFYFIPYNYYKTTWYDPNNKKLNPEIFETKEKLTEFGKSNILGVEGLLWGENLQTEDQLEYLLFPKLLAVAERGWAKDPDWATENNPELFTRKYNQAWSEFVNIVGKKELKRLDHFAYRIPTVGATIKDGKVFANIQLPGLTIRYTTNDTSPSINSKVYNAPIAEKGIFKFSAFNNEGRSGRVIEIENK